MYLVKISCFQARRLGIEEKDLGIGGENECVAGTLQKRYSKVENGLWLVISVNLHL